MKFARVKEGPKTGELVPTIDVNRSINIIETSALNPPNPYRTGYGKRIPTRYKARVFDNRFRRVYIVQYANAGTPYIEYKGEAYAISF